MPLPASGARLVEIGERDDVDGAPALVIISHPLWQWRYGSDPGVLGRQLFVNNQKATIIGVMAEGVGFPSVAGVADLWLPLAQLTGGRTRPRDARTFMAVGRLADGVTLAQAHTDLSAIAARLSSQYPATTKDAQPTLLVYHDRFTAPQLRVVNFGLMSAAGVVLLIAFVNVSALLIAVLAIQLVDTVAIDDQLALLAAREVEVVHQGIAGIVIAPVALVVHARALVAALALAVLAWITPSSVRHRPSLRACCCLGCP